MASINKVILIGNLTRDPELNYTQSGTEVCELGLALNRRVKKHEQWTDEVTFVDVTIWGNQAKAASDYLNKGRQVYVEGRLQLDQWEDKQTGKGRSKLKIVGETIQFLGSKHDGDRPRQPQQQQPQPQEKRWPAPNQAAKPPTLDERPLREQVLDAAAAQKEETDDIPF